MGRAPRPAGGKHQVIVTYRYRVKNLSGLLNRQARAVSFVWNHCNEQQQRAVGWGRKWLRLRRHG